MTMHDSGEAEGGAEAASGGGPRKLLRTHTSPMQIRYLERRKPPIRVIVPGSCYRYEAVDATHEWMLTQFEGLAIDEGLSFAHLKGTLGVVRPPHLWAGHRDALPLRLLPLRRAGRRAGDSLAGQMA